MVNTLILYADGKYEEKQLKGLEEYQKIVGGDIEMLPVIKGYVNPNNNTKRRKLLCYVNEVGMIEQLPSSPWVGLLQLLGVSVHPGMPIFGNVIVFSEGKEGDEGAVDPYVVSLAKKHTECEDEGAKLKEVVITSKKRKEALKEDGEKKARSTDCWCNDETKEETKTCVVITC